MSVSKSILEKPMLYSFRFPSRSSIALVAGACVVLTACSMHPLPDDVGRVSTADIVEKIRCEAKQGLQHVGLHHPILKTAIGYDFTFDIDEDNNATKGQLKYDRPGFTKGSQTTWDLTGSSTRKRKNKREFRIVEKLEDLNKATCNPTAKRAAHWLYPITGTIGIDEVIRTYVRIEEMTNFRRDNQGRKIDGVPAVFSEELQYTTEFGGGVTPTLDLVTTVGKFRLTKATIFAEAKRKDVHSVTIALAQGADVPFGTLSMRSSLTPPEIQAVSPRLAVAVVEKNQTATNRVLIEPERRRVLREDEKLNIKLLEALRAIE